jgi:hypothetical protein
MHIHLNILSEKAMYIHLNILSENSEMDEEAGKGGGSWWPKGGW